MTYLFYVHFTYTKVNVELITFCIDLGNTDNSVKMTFIQLNHLLNFIHTALDYLCKHKKVR